MSDFYRNCSFCKKPIALATRYYVCSVSTCQRNATNFAFCSVDCWDAHLPTYRHKDAWAEERMSPRSAAEAEAQAPTPNVPHTKLKESPMSEETPKAEGSASEDVLIVASKLKAYIRAKSGMNTSSNVVDVLSGKVRKLADQAIAKAQSEGRKTVMDRDFDTV